MHFPSHPLVRQVIGSVCGVLAALALHQAYVWASPSLAALLPERGVAAERYTDETRAAKQEEIVAHARATLETLLQEDSDAR